MRVMREKVRVFQEWSEQGDGQVEEEGADAKEAEDDEGIREEVGRRIRSSGLKKLSGYSKSSRRYCNFVSYYWTTHCKMMNTRVLLLVGWLFWERKTAKGG